MVTKERAMTEDKSLNAEVLISKNEWKSLCKKYGQWCNFEDVKNYTLVEAEKYIKNMPCWTPM